MRLARQDRPRPGAARAGRGRRGRRAVGRGPRRLVGDAAEEEPGRGDDRDRRRDCARRITPPRCSRRWRRRTSAASATGRPSWPSGRRSSSTTHGALVALADACAGLDVDAARMRDNIERQHGTVFAEAAAALLAPSLGKAKAHALLATLVARAAREGAQLHALLRADPAARAHRRRPRSMPLSTSTPRRAAPARWPRPSSTASRLRLPERAAP